MRRRDATEVPEGYGGFEDSASAPFWLRLRLRLPFLKTRACEEAYQQGVFYISPIPEWPEDEFGAVPQGWRVVAWDTRNIEVPGEWTNIDPRS